MNKYKIELSTNGAIVICLIDGKPFLKLSKKEQLDLIGAFHTIEQSWKRDVKQ